MDTGPYAFVTEKFEVSVDAGPGSELLGQQAPGATGAIDVEDGIEHIAHIGGSRSSAEFGGREQRPDEIPLSIGKIGIVGHGRLLSARS